MKPQGKEALKFLEEYGDGKRDPKGKAQMMAKYGVTARKLRGLAEELKKDRDAGLLEEKEIVYTPYPDLKIVPFKVGKVKRDEEDIVIVWVDRHTGKITKSYNTDIEQERTDYLLDSLMTIINLHRPIRRAFIFALGDNVQGENPHQGSKIDDVKCNARQQINLYEIPMLKKFLVSLSQGVEQVIFYGVRGNHGKYEKLSPDGTNWDLFLYDRLKDALQNQKNISINYSEDFNLLVNIRGFRFFLIHGDQCKGNAAFPVIAMQRKMSKWYANVGGFNYAYAGHFHSEHKDAVNAMADYTICPPLVTGDSWAVERIGNISHPQQLCFGVHKKYGRTFTYTLHTDNAFLPKKFDEPEGIVA